MINLARPKPLTPAELSMLAAAGTCGAEWTEPDWIEQEPITFACLELRLIPHVCGVHASLVDALWTDRT